VIASLSSLYQVQGQAIYIKINPVKNPPKILPELDCYVPEFKFELSELELSESELLESEFPELSESELSEFPELSEPKIDPKFRLPLDSTYSSSLISSSSN